MIDFRYHLVSLVAVFLALAVGIVLGAGPLATPIGDALTGQVDKLRADRNALSKELNDSKAILAANEQTTAKFAPRLYNKMLANQKVALVVLPGARSEDVKAVSDQLTVAGAAICAQVNVSDNFFSPKKKAYREAMSGQLTEYLRDASRATTPDSTLAAALGQQIFVEKNDSLSAIMTVKDTPLMQMVTPPNAPARAAVIVGPPPLQQTPETASASNTVEERAATYAEFVRTLNSFNDGVTVYGSAKSANDVVAQIRAAGNPAPTVDSIGAMSALLILPFAVVARMNGTAGAWGNEKDATALVPPLMTVPESQPAAAAPGAPQ